MTVTMIGMNRLILMVLSYLVWTVTAEDIFGSEICGTRSLHDFQPQPRLFNGRDAPLGAWPWIGQFTDRFQCLAALIGEQWAVTTALCNHVSEGDDVTVVFGGTERKEGTSPYGQEVKILGAYSHPGYIALVQNDIALLHLEPLNFTDYVRPICINQLSNEWEAYSNCWIAGRGLINAYGERSKNLQEAPSRVIPQEQCQEQHLFFGKVIHESEICGLAGGNGEPRLCAGRDTGGPLMCSDDGGFRWSLVGQFIALGGECGNNTSVFSRLSNLFSFIETTVRRVEDCSDPDRRCNDGVVCLLEGEMCDGEEQCPDGEDEMGCSPDSMCTNTTCLNDGVCTENDEGYICECSEGWTGTHCETVMCGEANISISVGSTVNLTSPFYPYNYPNRLSCQWTVTVPEGYKVLVEFLDFNTEEGFDFLRLNDSNLSGVVPPPNFTSVGESLDVDFTTDGAINGRGFLLRLSPIDVSGINECEWIPCLNNGTCVNEPDGFSCECEGIWSGRICSSPDAAAYCGDQDITLTSDSTYELKSFNYPGRNFYQPSYSCKWIVTAPPGKLVRAEFMDLKLFAGYDFITLNAQAFSGLETPQEDFVTDGNRLEIVFFTFGWLQSLGFHMLLSDYLLPDGDECASQPCQNGGLCYDNVNGFSCKCRRGFTGRTCQDGLSRCGRNSFQCNNGRCTKASNVCDGRNHCGDESDELNCNCEFNCYNGRCIPQRYVCDKNNNCGDWSDELRPNC